MAASDRKTSRWKIFGFLALLSLVGVWATIVSTAFASLILELMRWAGPWLGLGMTAGGLLGALLVVPGLGKKRYSKRSFTTLVAVWCGLMLLVLLLFFPVDRWFRERGSFVPSLLLGPNRTVVKRVVVDGLGWGEEWKLRPSLRGKKAYITGKAPTPSPD